MIRLVDHPLVLLAVCFVVLSAVAYVGDLLRRKVRPIAGDERTDFDIVLSATLTLLALIIGFSFSMAVSRYDDRKNDEAEEANAIGTEYVRLDLLPGPAQTQLRDLLRRYTEDRISYYRATGTETAVVSSEEIKLQSQLWAGVANVGTAQPNPVTALAVSGMNDVLNSQGYTKASWLNRIPVAAWTLLAFTAVLANMLLGYRERRTDLLILIVLPLTVSIALFLIADIDTPRGGIIRIAPKNLMAVAEVISAR